MSASLTSSASPLSTSTIRASIAEAASRSTSLSSAPDALSRLSTTLTRSATTTTARYVTATGRLGTTTIRRLTATAYATATASSRPKAGSGGGSRLSGLMILPLFIGGFVGTLLLGIALCLIFSKTCRQRLRRSNNPFSSSSYPPPLAQQPPSLPPRLGPDGFPLAGAALRLSRSLDEADLRRARAAQARVGEVSGSGLAASGRWTEGWSTANWLFARIVLDGLDDDGDEGKPPLWAVEMRPVDGAALPVGLAVLGGRKAERTFLVQLPCPSSAASVAGEQAQLPELEFGVEVLALEGEWLPSK